MGLNYMDKEFVELSKHRLEQAKQCLVSAKVLADYRDYKGAANRFTMKLKNMFWQS